MSIVPDTSLTLINEDGTWRFSGWSRHTFTELADPSPEDRARRFRTLESAAAYFRDQDPRGASGTPRSRSLRFLGEARVAEHRFAFYRVGGVHDVVLTRGGNQADRFHIPRVDGSLTSLQHIANWLLGAHCWGTSDDPPEECGELRVLDDCDGELRAELWRAGACLGELRVGSRGRYAEPLLAWSLEARPAMAEARGPLHRAALDVVAHYLAGVAPRSSEDAREEWRQLCVDLGDQRPRHEAALLAGAARVRIMISLPTRCQQACVFCASPLQDPQRRVSGTPDEHVRRLSAYLDDLLASSERDRTLVEVVLVGDDALSHPRLDAILALLDRAPVRSFRILTPGGSLARDGVAAALARHHNCRGVILTLLGPNAEVHDRVAGRRGAFADFERAVAQCRAAGIEVSLNSILTPHNAAALGATLEVARGLGVKLCLYLFTTEPMTDAAQARACAMSPAAARAAIDAAGPDRFAVVQRINYAPLCYLPPWARPLAADASNWFPDPAASLPSGCIDCGLRQAGCPGPTRGLIEALGSEVFVGE